MVALKRWLDGACAAPARAGPGSCRRSAIGVALGSDARYHGREQHGEATFHADDKQRRIEWRSPSGYCGWMEVAPDGQGSRLTLFLNAVHGSESDHDIAATLDAIRMLVDAQV